MASSLPLWLRKEGAQPHSIFTSKLFYLPAISLLTLIIIIQSWNPISLRASKVPSRSYTDDHIIHDLVDKADQRFEELRRAETYSVANAAKRYRERRGRHPPPGFDKWYTTARHSSTVMIEEFYDQIYEDLEPFWGIEPQELREFAERWPSTISIRAGRVELRAEGLNMHNWLWTWQNMTKEMGDLPDVDLTVLVADQPMVLANFSRVNERMQSANLRLKEHRALSANQIKREFSSRPPITTDIVTSKPQEGLVPYPENSDEFWNYVVSACKPDDPVFKSPELVPNSSFPLVFSETYTAGSTQGFVSNFTQSRLVCHNPNLRTLHGFMIRPGVVEFYNDLFPIFSIGKIAGIHNDIVLPAPENYKQGIYSGTQSMQPWTEKKNAVVWRGSATGGDWRPDTWFGYQRHRFVSMLNATVVRQAQKEMSVLTMRHLPQTYQSLLEDAKSRNETLDLGVHNIQLPSSSLFRHSLAGLAEWLENTATAGFTHLFCWPFRTLGPPGDCPYVAPYYKLADLISTSEVLMHKYLPDIDGQSISGRFRGFLQSTSVPIKATIFSEWHDSRLTPWRDFVPLSNEFQELYELLYYFIGDKTKSQLNKRSSKLSNWWQAERGALRHNDPDAIAERIGQQGSEWTRRVMRREDMVLYLYRLILEYARITSDDRVELGWVDDLLAKDTTDAF